MDKMNTLPDSTGNFRDAGHKNYRAWLSTAAIGLASLSCAYAQTQAPPTPAPTPAPAPKAAPKAVPKKTVASAKKGVEAPQPLCQSTAPSVHVSVPLKKMVILDLKKLNLPEPGWLRRFSDPSVVKITPMTSRAPRSEFSLYGKKIGATSMTFRTEDGRCAQIELTVSTNMSTVQNKIAELLPEERDIRVTSAGSATVLVGTVMDPTSADRAVTIAKAYQSKGATGAKSAGSSSIDVINLLNVAAPQQVMLEVKIAEVQKSLLDKLGVKLGVSGSTGSWTHRLSSNFLAGDGSGVAGATAGAALTMQKSSTKFGTIDAQKDDGLVKILAEPNIMAVSGQEGSFLAGGKIYVPVPQSGTTIGSGGGITLEEQEYGVGLKFLPTVLAGGRINIRVSPEVSELVSLNATAGTNIVIPEISTRRAATTVQLYDGQSFAIGGLIKSKSSGNISAFPGLGEIPILGALFRSTEFQNDRTELVFVITPRLVKPLPPNYTLPTDNVKDPNRADYLLNGRLEATPPKRQAAAKSEAANKPADNASPDAKGNGAAAATPGAAPSGFEN